MPDPLFPLIHDRVSRVTSERGVQLDRASLDRIVAEHASVLTAGGPGWALAQFDDAVCWASLQQGALIWPPGREEEDLDPLFLDDLRVFGEAGELHLWRRSDDRFSYRVRVDANADAGADVCQTLDEPQYLWGTLPTRVADAAGTDAAGALRWWDIEEGARGIVQRVPWAGDLAERDLPMRLGVRVYLATDDHGAVDVCDYRLTGLHRRENSSPVSGGNV